MTLGFDLVSAVYDLLDDVILVTAVGVTVLAYFIPYLCIVHALCLFMIHPLLLTILVCLLCSCI